LTWRDWARIAAGKIYCLSSFHGSGVYLKSPWSSCLLQYNNKKYQKLRQVRRFKQIHSKALSRASIIKQRQQRLLDERQRFRNSFRSKIYFFKILQFYICCWMYGGWADWTFFTFYYGLSKTPYALHFICVLEKLLLYSLHFLKWRQMSRLCNIHSL